MKAIEVLRAIPKHLDTYGWCQGLDHDGDGAVCLRGAINDLTAIPATRAEVHLRLQMVTHRHIVIWNDVKGRTVDQVKEACLVAADLDPTASSLSDEELEGYIEHIVDKMHPAAIEFAMKEPWLSPRQFVIWMMELDNEGVKRIRVNKWLNELEAEQLQCS